MKRVISVLAGAGLFWVLLSSEPTQGQASDSTGEKSAVTFTRDIAPIFYKSCAGCHRPNDIAPMPLITYKDARPWARSIREKVVTRQMPPWHADPAHGKFANDPRLTQEEVDRIVRWVDEGAREGDPRELPPPPHFPEGWKIGKPDLVLSMPNDYLLGAEGPDEYINFTMPTNFTEDKWIQAAEIHPGNKRIVHHVVAFIQTPQMAAQARISQLRPNPQSIFYAEGTLIRTKMDAPVYDDGCASPNGGIARGKRPGRTGLAALLLHAGQEHRHLARGGCGACSRRLSHHNPDALLEDYWKARTGPH